MVREAPERFHLLESIDRNEQETAIKVIDALIAKRRVEEPSAAATDA
jgi:hypothetical protein